MIERWSEGAADDNMAEDILVELGEVVRRHPWWRARTRLTLRLLRDLDVAPPARVLDAGCGWGTTLEALEARGYQAVGMDISRRILERLDRPGRALVEADLSGPLKAAEPYRAVLALDVIEHLDDDREAKPSVKGDAPRAVVDDDCRMIDAEARAIPAAPSPRRRQRICGKLQQLERMALGIAHQLRAPVAGAGQRALRHDHQPGRRDVVAAQCRRLV